MTQSSQLEFVDICRGQKRPSSSGGMVIDGLWVFHDLAQSVAHVAYTLGKTNEHVRHLIDEGSFPNVYNFGSKNAAKASWVIPRNDVLDYLNFSKVTVCKRTTRAAR